MLEDIIKRIDQRTKMIEKRHIRIEAKVNTQRINQINQTGNAKRINWIDETIFKNIDTVKLIQIRF